MKILAVVIALVVAASAVAGFVWVGTGGKPTLPLLADNKLDENDPNQPLPIAEKGPYPKVVVDESQYEFDVMAVGEERKHTFVVRNVGEAPLKLKKGVNTCKCTLSELARDEVPPGETAQIELSWKPVASDEDFRQAAFIWTNDPEKKQIELVVQGRAAQALVITPDRWDLGTIAEGMPSEVTGTIHSVIYDDFEISTIETSSEYVTAEPMPIEGEELEEIDADAKKAFRIRATVQPEMPVGRFQETVTLVVNANGTKRFPLELHGTRPGPLQFVKLPGYEWYPESLAMSFGRFKASEGRKGTVLLVVHGMNEQAFEFTDVQTDPEFLQVKLEPAGPEGAGDRQSYRISIEVPPGSPAVSRMRPDSGEIHVKTNHPDAPEIKLHAEFVSY
jgi:hypothetical protein